MSTVAIHTFLRPLAPYLNEKGVSEISINKPQEVWVEKEGRMQCYIVPELDFPHIRTLSNLVAKYSAIAIGHSSGRLPRADCSSPSRGNGLCGNFYS